MPTRNASTTATWLLLCLALVVLPCWSSQGQSFSRAYDRQIQQATGQYWPDLPAWKLLKAQLYQESQLNPNAVSPVGAAGLGQFMPGTWSDVVREMRWDARARPSPFDPSLAIGAAAYYQGKARRAWGAAGRTALERNKLGLCSYNAGFGNCLKAQKLCANALLWAEIDPCMVRVTGVQFSHETHTYIERITTRWWPALERQP